MACIYSSNGVIRELLKCENIDVNVKNQYNESPLTSLCKNGNIQMVKELLKNKDLNVDEYDEDKINPFISSYKYGYHKLAKLFLDSGRVDMIKLKNNLEYLEYDDILEFIEKYHIENAAKIYSCIVCISDDYLKINS